MAWIELHQSLPTHRKTLALCDSLGIEPVHAVGHLTCLWLWALDNAPSGDLRGISPRTIARAAMWKKSPESFLAALQDAGFVEADSAIHDWAKYAGRLVERRQRDAERKRTDRGSPPEIPPPSGGHPADNTRMSGASRAHITGPNPTVPNQTGPLVPNGTGEVDAEPSPGDDRVDEVYAHFKTRVQPRSRLCPRKKIAARLKRFSVSELKEGIDHFADDPWWMENNASRGAEWFFESDTRAEQFLLMVPRSKPAVVPLNGHVKRAPDAPPDVPADSPFLQFREVS